MSNQILGKEVLTTLKERLCLTRSCLLVIDVQNDFCSVGGAADRKSMGTGNVQKVLGPLGSLIDCAHRSGIPVIDILMTTYPDGHTNSDVDLARRSALWSGTGLITLEGSWGYRNPDELPVGSSDLVVRKYRNNAFLGTNLELILRSNSIKTVVVSGLSTHACVLETALMAQGLDYYVVVPADCVASSSKELNEAGLLVLKSVLHGDGVATAHQIIEVWSNKR